MSRLDSLNAAGLLAAVGTFTISAHVLAINAAAAATIRTTGAIVSQIDGVTRSRAALAAQSIVPTHNIFGDVAAGARVQPASTTVYYVLGVNAAGAVAVVQGTYSGEMFAPAPTSGIGLFSNGGTQMSGTGEIPSLPAGHAPFGLIKVVTNGSTTFTPGTTALDAAGLTVSFFDIGLIPAVRP